MNRDDLATGLKGVLLSPSSSDGRNSGDGNENTVYLKRQGSTGERSPGPSLEQRQDSLRQALTAVNEALASEDAAEKEKQAPASAAGREPTGAPSNAPATPDAHANPVGDAPAPPAAADAPASQPAAQDQQPSQPILRGEQAAMNVPKTQIVRGQRRPTRTDFHQEPVVGWLVVIGGPGLGAFRPLFTGNNTIGRASTNRVPIDFGDDTISTQEQAYVRYDAADREFLFVPNLSKTNVVSVNENKPTTAVRLSPMDVITMGQTQLVFVPFCGDDFDWSELADLES